MTRTWWRYVTSVNPLMVARHADDSPTSSVRVSGCLVPGLVVGDRVLMQVNGTAATILGKNYTYADLEDILAVNALVAQRMADRLGGQIGTGGKAVVCIRFDHNTDYLGYDGLGGVHIETGVPATLAVYSQMRELAPEYNSRSWSSLQGLAGKYGFRPGNHGATHGDQTTEAGYYLEAVQSKYDIEANMPNCVIESMTIPGVGGTRWGGFDGRELTDYTELPVGRLFMEHHGLLEGRLPPDTDPNLHALDGVVRLGLRRTDIETLTFAQAKAKIVAAQNATPVAGVILMLHPRYIGMSGYMSVADYEALIRWIAAERNAGRLIPMTMEGLAVANQSHSNRLDLVQNGGFTSGTSTDQDFWDESSGGDWRTRSHSGMSIDGMSTRNMPGASITQVVNVPAVNRGGTFTLSFNAWGSGESGQTTRTVTVDINNGYISRSFPVTLLDANSPPPTMSMVLDLRLSQYTVKISASDSLSGTIYINNVKLQPV